MNHRSMQLRTTPHRHRAGGSSEHGSQSEHALDVSWSGEPDGTRSFVVLIEGANGRGNDEPWIRFDVPAAVHDLSTADPRVGRSGGAAATTDWRDPADAGGATDNGADDRVCRLYALDVPSLELATGASLGEVERRIQGHVLGSTEVIGSTAGALVDQAGHATRSRTHRVFDRQPQLLRTGMVWLGVVLMGLVVLAFTGMVVAGVLTSLAIVMLMIWAGWRSARRQVSKPDRIPDGRAARRSPRGGRGPNAPH